MASPHTTTVEPHLAAEPGALGGWRVTCSCGMTWTVSLEGIARAEAVKHLDWHDRNELRAEGQIR